MAKVVRRLLSLLFALKFYDKHYKIIYGGKIVSFNQIYSGSHWSKRSAIKIKFHEIFEILLLEAKVKPMKEMFLVIFFNTRHDCDNIVLTAKFLLDTMKGKYIEDDTSKFYKGIQIVHDSELPKGQLEMHILGK
jgi:Endodeoxyribonuclease RusA.